jgi:hypothetical protein
MFVTILIDVKSEYLLRLRYCSKNCLRECSMLSRNPCCTTGFITPDDDTRSSGTIYPRLFVFHSKGSHDELTNIYPLEHVIFLHLF